jgi:hypothetical protein
MPTVWVLPADPAKDLETCVVESIDDLYVLLPSRKRHKASMAHDDYEFKLKDGIRMIYDTTAFSPPSCQGRSINLRATRILLDNQLLEPPLVYSYDPANQAAFFATLPIGPVVFYKLDAADEKRLVDIKRRRDPEPSERDRKLGAPAISTHQLLENELFDERGEAAAKKKKPYVVLAKERYQSYSQALQEYFTLQSRSSLPLAASLIEYYLLEPPRLTCTQLDRLQVAVLGAALYHLFWKAV